MQGKLTPGPGFVTKALGLTLKQNHISLIGNTLWVENRQLTVGEVLATPRVGVSYAKEHALLPWRFRIKNSLWTSRAK